MVIAALHKRPVSYLFYIYLKLPITLLLNLISGSLMSLLIPLKCLTYC